ncbi:hypothetical protein QOZ80_7BG0601540 [Eleusine coracana subsp. coracana]|nr:hypothetical protein QOZ80_7BG0601540 [Eleusine coracana subsp. coracana]
MPSAPVHRPCKRPALPAPEESHDGDGEADRISALPDDVLHLVLVRLGCSCEAARTSVLARRWRGLWTCLPEYSFGCIETMLAEEVEAVLARVTRPALDSLDIEAELVPDLAADCASSLLRAAARLSPETVEITLYNPEDEEAAVELPCFDRTSTLILEMNGVPLAPPPAGVFSRLECLELTTSSNIFDALLPSCPLLRVLRIRAYRELKEITVHSMTLEELTVERVYVFSSMYRIEIDAPELRKSKLDVEMGGDFSLTFSAPNVEELVWNLPSIGNVGLAELRLFSLNYSLRHGARTLRLEIDWTYETEDTDRSFAEENEARLKRRIKSNKNNCAHKIVPVDILSTGKVKLYLCLILKR